ncbi:lipopolysaccharide/colanic/teichoic acid biosynthesis glycosyltransferase [Marivita geojedonensis]|nr:lipopolysaccharide/colanic/teichoic acid biosynthesis glycosyltransferase [Marivita geojedonensis]
MDDVAGLATSKRRSSFVFKAFKRLFDLFVSLMLLPLLAASALAILALNPLLNRGPLLFRQQRMGRHCQPFVAYKFRTLLPCTLSHRDVNDPLEHHRITKLGKFLRRTRLDELPQIINVLKGEMSLIGPRPDYLPHAQVFLKDIPGYRERHEVRPGISGLAQTEIGYVQGPSDTRRKVLADLYYIRNSGFLLEFWIVWRTLLIVFGGKGL